MFKIPTYEEAVQMCANNPAVFQETRSIVGDYEVSMFNYFLARYSDFKEQLDLGSLEMRGLTFIHHNGESKPFIALHKFFNVNENESTLLDNVKHLRVSRAYEKLDGSLISFVLLPNGRVLAKSKMSFTSDQAVKAQAILDGDTRLYSTIYNMLLDGKMPIMEITGYDNQVVVSYEHEASLSLLHVRDMNTGEYLVNNKDMYWLDRVHQYHNTSLESYIRSMENMTNQEGYVLVLENGQFVKLKCPWYLALHGTVGDTKVSTKRVVECILNETLDDVYSALDSKSQKYQAVLRIEDAFHDRLAELLNQATAMLTYKEVNKLDRKGFAMTYSAGSNDQKLLFSILVKELDNAPNFDKIEHEIVERIRQIALKEERMINFLKL